MSFSEYSFVASLGDLRVGGGPVFFGVILLGFFEDLFVLIADLGGLHGDSLISKLNKTHQL